jgi:predicted GTPase
MQSSLVRREKQPSSVVQEALRLLRVFAQQVPGDGGLLTSEEIAPLERLQNEAGYYRADVPRLLLLGEFKAGKSTLLNAVLGGEYAATDILEMTSWIARYWPHETGFCRVVNHDGAEYEVAPDEFRRRCQSREIPESELARIQQVDVGVPRPYLRFSLMDCPGIGSVTRENERRLVRAIDDADLLIWVVDIESVGGMREAALIQKLRGQGMPMLAILTKCD